MKNYYIKMADGTVKQINPFTGTEVWSVPGRASKPINNVVPAHAQPILAKPPQDEDFCNFCAKKYINTPPEKARMVKQSDGQYRILKNLLPSEIFSSWALFRRIPNLFEIVSYEYWEKNFHFKPSEEDQQHKQAYLSTPEGKAHVDNVVKLKLKSSGKSEAEMAAISEADKMRIADAFFSGAHELIVSGKHFKNDATHDSQLCSSGELTPEEHYLYFQFTIEAMKDIFAKNRYCRYISVFQNWLAPAGASFDHLHKQLVGIDEWGTSIENEVELIRRNPNIYNDLAVNFAGYHNLIIAENDFAVAFADIGHRFPTISIFSKSSKARPREYSSEEVRGFSDIVHACHAAMGSSIPCNEEWYYPPIDCVEKMPWHILIKWRTNNPAGFEGGTKIYINALAPEDVRDKLVPRLHELKSAGKIADFPVGAECSAKPNSLRYLQD